MGEAVTGKATAAAVHQGCIARTGIAGNALPGLSRHVARIEEFLV